MSSLGGSAVLRVRDDERARVFASLASAFSADPLMRWMYPEAADFLRAATGEFYEAFGGGAIGQETAFRCDGFEGAALWHAPGSGPDEERLVAAMQASIREEIHEDCVGLLEGMQRYHPEDPCWYLAVLGVDHAYQGRGYGAQLMKHALAHIDTQGLPAYLESSSPMNISLYKRHGFEEMGIIQSGSSPVLIPMLRVARN
ncbi:MAG: ribosomal protein S18 acetylase RimI-like enzyme [Halieaceae bacterium]|jgi:ribosomal protein S18 acetylase RimI-like enzyme